MILSHHHPFLVFGIFLAMLLLASPLSAASFSKDRLQVTQIQDNKLEQKIAALRDTFIAAEKALERKQSKTFQRLLKQLVDYPLYPYLVYRDLRGNLSKTPDSEVLAFIEQYKATPYAEKIRRKWLDAKAKKGQWRAYLKGYIPQSSVRRQCDYLNALLNHGQKQEAFQQVKGIWLNGKSQPKSCDPIFKAWEHDGHITDNLRWQRIKLAMGKGQISLAKYLVKPLAKNDKDFLQQWIDLHRKPQKLMKSTLLQFPGKKLSHPMQADLVLHVVKRLARKKPDLAIKHWPKIEKQWQFIEPDRAEVYRAIGLSLARKHKPDGWYWLDKVGDQYSDKSVREWRVRAAIREQDWPAIQDAIARLPEEEQESSRWKYWLAEVKDGLGLTKDANEIYQQLALTRGYYGFLSADKLDMPYQFEHSPLAVSNQEIKKIETHPGILRAREFYNLKWAINAKREWYFTTSKLFNEKQRIIAAKIAQKWGWHERAILTIAHTKERDDMELRFPIMYKDRVAHYSKLNQLDDAYTYAVIRRESAFATDAHSRAGALGLMQIMPATGRYVAKQMKLRYKGKNQLLSAETNLKMGTHYLQKMLKKFDQQPVLASAAYNAGDHRVKRWLPIKANMPAINWVESIPFKETREYVSAILAYTSIYQHRLGKSVTRLETRMPDVPKK